MKILLIILSVLGVLRIVELLFELAFSIYCEIKYKDNFIGINKLSLFHITHDCYLLPTFSIYFYKNSWEFIIYFLKFSYYNAYSLDTGDNESSSV